MKTKKRVETLKEEDLLKRISELENSYREVVKLANTRLEEINQLKVELEKVRRANNNLDNWMHKGVTFTRTY